MAITISRKPIPPSCPAAGAWAVLFIVLAVPVRAGAADWSVAPALRLREGYTDNVTLAPPGQARDDFITEISPEVVVRGRAQRLRLDLSYRLQQLFYTRRGDRTLHQMKGDANAELLEDWLFVDLRSSISQSSVTPFGPQPLDNVATDNQRTVRTARFSPYLRHHLRGVATAELRYARESVDSGRLLSVDSDSLLLDLGGDRNAADLGWNLHASRREIRNRQPETVRKEQVALSLRYPLGNHVGLFATAGYEDEGYQSLGAAAPRGKHWLMGASWYPSARSSVVASAGRRFFGNTYALDLSHRSRRTNWSLGYHEDITSAPGQFLRLSDGATASLLDQLWRGAIPDPQLRRQRVDSFLRFSQLLGPDVGAVNYFSQRYFLQKQLGLSMAATMPKSTLVLGLTATRRTAQSAIGIDSVLLPAFDIALVERTRQVGASAGWESRLSARTSVSVSAAYSTVTSLDVGRKDNNLAFGAALTRKLQRKVDGAIELRHVRHDSNHGRGYRENAISASLNFQL